MNVSRPYWGKPAVRNFRGGGGNIGIIRSPVRRATALPDTATPLQRAQRAQRAQRPTWYTQAGYVKRKSDSLGG